MIYDFFDKIFSSREKIRFFLQNFDFRLLTIFLTKNFNLKILIFRLLIKQKLIFNVNFRILTKQFDF